MAIAVDHHDLMLCGDNQSPFSHPDWYFELKWDGFRCLCLRKSKELKLLSRNGRDMALQFPEVVQDMKRLPGGTAIDGELVILDADGHPLWDEVRTRSSMRTQAKVLQAAIEQPAVVMAFDLLTYARTDCRKLPLVDRKQLLDKAVRECLSIKYDQPFDEHGKELFRQINKLGLEGLVAKRKDSSYVAGRSMCWIKIKTEAGTEKEWARTKHPKRR